MLKSFIRKVLILIAVTLSGGVVFSADEFKWSWQKEEDVVKRETAVDSSGKPPVGSPRAAGVDPGAYAKLLQENQQLRKKIDQAEKDKQTIEQANASLSSEVKGMEQRIARMAGLIGELKKEKTSSDGNLDKTIGLESKLAEAEKEKARLVTELAQLRDRERRLQAEMARQRKDTPGPGPEKTSSRPTAKPGSDLFQEIEKENARLKEKLVKVEIEKQKAVKTRDEMLAKGAEADKKVREAVSEQKETEEKLVEIELREREQKKVIKKLMTQIPSMEEELTQLRASMNEKKTALNSSEDELETMKVELERREHRLVKAERMARLLQESHEKVQKANLTEKRDMHYNMAAIYAKEGRHRDAEREYLNALRIDPSDPDVHYNLGILYEEELGSTRKAVRHYKKYLELNPFAADADEVRGWLMRIDVQL